VHLSTRLTLVFVLTASLCDCGGGGEPGSSSGGGPISSAPLAGTVAGKPFTAKAALAKKSGTDATKKSVSIYDVDATCDKTPNADRYIVAAPIWQVGATQSGFNTAFNDFSKTPGLIGIAESSAIEIISAPIEIGAKGKLRLRAAYETDSVEGEVDVTVCQ
jgi:hypothetical protein